MRATLCAALGLAVAAATTGLAVPAEADTPRSYVALGDSYSAGWEVQPQVVGAPLLCGRSAVDYPQLTAQTLGLSLTDVTCGGATVSNMTQSQYPDQPPQFDALTADTGIVTMGIGGNDNGTFATAIGGCDSIDAADPANYGAPCQAVFGSYFADHIAADAPNIAAAIQRIHTLSPHASVYVVGYPDILPQQGNCWPQLPLTSGDVAYLDGVEHDLNTMLWTQAQANGATFVDTYTASIGHDACKPESVRWIEPLVPGNPASADGPVHPNAAGEAAMAVAVRSAISPGR